MMSHGLRELGLSDTQTPTLHVISSPIGKGFRVTIGWTGLSFLSLVALQPETATLAMSREDFAKFSKELSGAARIEFHELQSANAENSQTVSIPEKSANTKTGGA